MRLRKNLTLLSLLVLFSTSAAALSCISLYEAEMTFHCPTQEACEEDVRIENEREGITPVYEMSPSEFNGSFSTTEVGNRKYRMKKVENRGLPDIQQAVRESRDLCSGAPNKHLYPKESFESQELEDSKGCYRTHVTEKENYYSVERTSTTQPWYCTRKHVDTPIAGGDRSWVEPVDLKKLSKLDFWLHNVL